MQTVSKDLSVFIGRFSPFHNGHAAVIDRAIKTSKVVLILIGSSDIAPTTKNPFSFPIRKQMIQNYIKDNYPESNVIIEPLHDHPYNDNHWIKSVQDKVDIVKKTCSNILGNSPKVYLTGSDRDVSTKYLNFFGDFFIKDIVDAHPVGQDLSATQIRSLLFGELNNKIDSLEEVLKDSVPSSTLEMLNSFTRTDTYATLVKEFQFIKKYHNDWAAAPYAPTFVTTDACVVQSGHVLVNIRANFPGKGLYALPGGFLEQDEKLIDGCVRELIEETSIGLSVAQLYGSIQDKEIFDAPNRSLRGRTITTCFLFRLDDSKPLPKIKPQQGEVVKCMWMPISKALASREIWFEDHYDILTSMLAR